MTDDAIAELTPILGSVRAACKAAGRPQANHYRRHRQSPKPEKPVRERKPQPRALTPTERDTVRAVLNSPSFDDKAPASVYHELLDEGVHLCSPYRTVLAADHAGGERTPSWSNQRRRPIEKGSPGRRYGSVVGYSLGVPLAAGQWWLWQQHQDAPGRGSTSPPDTQPAL